MELLLNLAWLLLALPAYWLWRGSRGPLTACKFNAFQCFLALGCMLVILFPVVSATDDLHAMRAEMEESPASKRSIGQSHGVNPPASKCQTQPALALTSQSFVANEQAWYHLAEFLLSAPEAPAVLHAGRSPPRSLLG
ncbi:MAG TPA: hypothetical protein VE377_13590 [Candidatus Dormibacteraeota bacterium]|nr:hypothetical protein [Candidatus Dormibacteraeota bacterium]